MSITRIDAQLNGLIAQGKHLLAYVPVRAMVRPTTAPAAALAQAETATNDVNFEYINFVNGSTTYVGFHFPMPKSVNEGTTVEFHLHWIEEGGASSHVCRWQAEAQGLGDGETVDSAWGTAGVVDATGASGVMNVDVISAVTVADWEQGDLVFFRIARLGGHANDTLNVGAFLVGVSVLATINAKDDA